MKPPQTMVELRSLLRKSENWVHIDPQAKYKEVTVRLWGRGVVLRGGIVGTGISAKKRIEIKPGQLILSRIDARNGALGIVPTELGGAVVTNDFPVFDIDDRKLLPEFMGWLIKTKEFVQLCQRSSEGTTNRVRLQEERFLSERIALPSLSEQERIVGRVERISREADHLVAACAAGREQLQELAAAMEMSIWPESVLGSAPRLEDVTKYLARGRQSRQGRSDHYLIKTRHVQQGRYERSAITLAPDAAARVVGDARVQYGDILIACSAAGCLGRVAHYLVQEVTASADTHVAVVRSDPDRILPDYLFAYLRGAQGQLQLRSRERGDWQREKVGFRLTELNLADLKMVPVPLPPFEEQKRVVDLLQEFYLRLDELGRLQSDTAGDAQTVLPLVLMESFAPVV